MKNRLNSKKGFSLIEMLIVIAIIGIIAVMALTTFSGVLKNGKKKADASTAIDLQKQITLMLRETETSKPTTVNSSWNTVDNLLEGLQSSFTYDASNDGTFESFGPYLQAKNGIVSAQNYDPQWNPSQGGTYTGWNISINNTTRDVLVIPQSGDVASGF